MTENVQLIYCTVLLVLFAKEHMEFLLTSCEGVFVFEKEKCLY